MANTPPLPAKLNLTNPVRNRGGKVSKPMSLREVLFGNRDDKEEEEAEEEEEED